MLESDDAAEYGASGEDKQRDLKLLSISYGR